MGVLSSAPFLLLPSFFPLPSPLSLTLPSFFLPFLPLPTLAFCSVSHREVSIPHLYKPVGSPGILTKFISYKVHLLSHFGLERKLSFSSTHSVIPLSPCPSALSVHRLSQRPSAALLGSTLLLKPGLSHGRSPTGLHGQLWLTVILWNDKHGSEYRGHFPLLQKRLRMASFSSQMPAGLGKQALALRVSGD